MRTTTILIQAPQSITVLQLFRSHGDTVPQLFRSHGDATLSVSYGDEFQCSPFEVTGFTGAQWLIPLGIGDQTLRETLHNLYPAHFRQIEPVGATVLNLDDDDKFALLIPEEGTIQIFDSLALQKPIDQMKIPENTRLVQMTRLALAMVDQSGRMHIKYRFLVSFEE